MSNSKLLCSCLLFAFAMLQVGSAYGFLPGTRWGSTSQGGTGQEGNPLTLSWSFVPDGTNIPNEGSGSDLIGFLDTHWGQGDGGTDLTLRPWFHFFEESFNRWSELSGVTFQYEAQDDGVTHGTAAGSRNRRGDIRVGGTFIDGPGATLAYNQLPNGGDMVLDTGDVNFFKNANSDYIRLRNVIMHELGHGLGFNHVNSSTDALLLEPVINTTFYGPQLDEVRAIQYYYGDAYEKSFHGLGNGTALRATNLGEATYGSLVTIGADADLSNQRVEATQIDFVSIDHLSDVDVFSFTIDGPALLDAVLTPRGGVFSQGSENATPTTFDANARADLKLEILDVNGTTVLTTADLGELGAIEEVRDLALPDAGAYFARISSLTDTIQLYQLDLEVRLPDSLRLASDFNASGTVDQVDFDDWQLGFGNDGLGDADRDGDTDGLDFLTWQRQFGSDSGPNPAAQAVPEPTPLAIALVGLVASASTKSRRRLTAGECIMCLADEMGR